MCEGEGGWWICPNCIDHRRRGEVWDKEKKMFVRKGRNAHEETGMQKKMDGGYS
jgi:hypothetical protein